MGIARRVVVSVVATCLTGAVASVASAQSASPAAPSPPGLPAATHWRISSGYGWFGLRDIARTGQPVDASPVEWHGQGLTLEAARTHTNGSRLHRIDITAAFTGDFEYRTPLASFDRPGSDAYRAVDGVYEYRRYFLSNLFMDGLDVGIGVQALGRYTSLSRHVGDSITASESTWGLGPAVVAAARLRRWSRVQGEVAWTNGGLIARLGSEHSEGGQYSSTWGGGWLTNLSAAADIRLTRQASLAIRYFGAHEGLLADHRNAAMSHGAFTAGVTYAK